MNWGWPIQFLSSLYHQIAASALLTWLVVALFISSSISTFDIRIQEAMRVGDLPLDRPRLPEWAGVFMFLDLVILIVLLVIDWRLALKIWAVRFVLKVIPVLETIGNVLMAPFKPRD